MPYILQSERPEIKAAIDEAGLKISSAGQLNYAICMLAMAYLRKHGLKYANINDILGAMSGAHDEFYRRVAAKYEDKKALQNGDVFDVPDQP